MFSFHTIFGLALVSVATSFDPENISPCHYETVSTVRCIGLSIDDQTIKQIGKGMANAEFRLLVIHNSAITHIPNNTFGNSVIENIQITNNSRLISIESHAFKKSPAVQNLTINYNPKFSDHNVFSLARYLEPSDSISLIGNSLTEIPTDAFRSQNPEKNTLQRILLSHNNISKVGQYAFQGLPNLKQISLDHNHIISIADYAFEFEVTQAGHIMLSLSNNELKSQSFTVHSFGSHVSVTIDLEQNLFTDLPEVIFKPLLSNKKNTIYLYNNNFSCDCSMKWIISKPIIENIYGVFCPNKMLSIFSLTEKDFSCDQSTI